MAKDEARDEARRVPDPEIAAADWLFQDDPASTPAKPPPKPIPSDSAGTGEIFDLADGQGSSVDLAPAQEPTPFVPGPATWDQQARPRREKKTGRVADQPMLDPSALVEEVWSRMSEWGATLVIVGGWLAVALTVVYFAFDADLFGVAFVTFLITAVVAIVLCYPIWITLERPVRITPEQAARDFYGSLSHHFPHFRRMWLLLSTAGRTSTAFGSYEGFKAYWKDRLATLRAGHASGMTPLVFEVANFKADKSAGKVKIDAEYTINVWVRGQRKTGVIHAIPMKIALVRGPDKMWYLENGTLGRDAS